MALLDATIDTLVFADAARILDDNPDLDGVGPAPSQLSVSQTLRLGVPLFGSQMPSALHAGPSDPHYLRFAQPRALGLKVSDEFTVPLCRGHHRQLHQAGNEVAWWQNLHINPLETARALWVENHPKPVPTIDVGTLTLNADGSADNPTRPQANGIIDAAGSARLPAKP